MQFIGVVGRSPCIGARSTPSATHRPVLDAVALQRRQQARRLAGGALPSAGEHCKQAAQAGATVTAAVDASERLARLLLLTVHINGLRARRPQGRRRRHASGIEAARRVPRAHDAVRDLLLLHEAAGRGARDGAREVHA